MMEKFVVLDVKTTGFEPGLDRVLEVALVVIERGRIVDEYHSLVNPGVKTKVGAMVVNGITDAMMAKAPFTKEVWTRVVEMIAEHPIVAHNASFDREFVSYELELLGLPELKSKWVCTRNIGLDILGYCPSLTDLVREVCGVVPLGSHRAMADVKALVGVTQRWWPWTDVEQVLGDFNIPIDKFENGCHDFI